MVIVTGVVAAAVASKFGFTIAGALGAVVAPLIVVPLLTIVHVQSVSGWPMVNGVEDGPALRR
jgi:hypothetical protein